jgi:hypothetical protein
MERRNSRDELSRQARCCRTFHRRHHYVIIRLCASCAKVLNCRNGCVVEVFRATQVREHVSNETNYYKSLINLCFDRYIRSAASLLSRMSDMINIENGRTSPRPTHYSSYLGITDYQPGNHLASDPGPTGVSNMNQYGISNQRPLNGFPHAVIASNPTSEYWRPKQPSRPLNDFSVTSHLNRVNRRGNQQNQTAPRQNPPRTTGNVDSHVRVIYGMIDESCRLKLQLEL